LTITPVLVLLLLLSLWFSHLLHWLDLGPALAQEPDGQAVPNQLVYNEQQTVYLTNLKRAAHGLPPLRWNRQLTEAARWFSWDSVENRPGGYCGHQDTNGQLPWDRAWLFGYYGFTGAENCFCGYVTPEYAVGGWYNERPPNDGHRRNLLNPDFWEVGLGYYRREGDGRGYVTQDFGVDSAYPPLVINKEAIQTNNPAVDLYIYSNRNAEVGITGLGPATQMMVSNDPCFSSATWEAYNAHKAWTLEAGTGWRTVYAKTRDASRRSTVVKDTIYLGPSIPYQDLSLEQAATRSGQTSLYELDGGGLPFMQFSLGWLMEMETGSLWWGDGEVVTDPAASADKAYRLYGDGSSFIWATPIDYPRNLNSQAYFRLKVNDNSAATSVARIEVKTNDVVRDFLELKGTDFTAAGVYQEFPLDFIQYDDPGCPWLIFGVEKKGGATVYVDRVVAFTAPEPLQASKTWGVPGSNYRGRTVWVRYTDNAGTFSDIAEAVTARSQLQVSPASLRFIGDYTRTVPSLQTLTVGYGEGCDRPPWSVQSNRSWLKVSKSPPHIQVWVDSSGLPLGTHQATLTVDAGPDILDSPQTIPVTFTFVDQLERVVLSIVIKDGW
jgi:uncharacterized protein YkwD